MKAVILAGGFATRLYPLTLNIPKPLLRLNGKVVLDIIMEKLSEIKLDKIYLTINEKFRKDFEEWVNERKHENIEIKVEKAMKNEEKPKNPKSTLIGTGIYFMKEEDFQIINDYVKAEPDKDHLGNLIAWLIKRKPVYAYRLSGIWIDIGSFESYELAKKLFG